MNDYDPDLDSTEEYFSRIEMMADGIEEEMEADPDYELNEAVWETVDSSRMVIYTHECINVLKYAQSQPEEWNHFVADGDSWQEVVQAMAFDIVRNDLWTEIRRRDVDDA